MVASDSRDRADTEKSEFDVVIAGDLVMSIRISS